MDTVCALYRYVSSACFSASAYMVDLFIGFPVRSLYLKGPSISGIGFWEGRDIAGICSYFSNLPATFWLTHIRECTEMIDKKLDAIVISVSVGIYVSVIVGLALYFGAWVFIVRPITNEIRKILTHHLHTP